MLDGQIKFSCNLHDMLDCWSLPYWENPTGDMQTDTDTVKKHGSARLSFISSLSQTDPLHLSAEADHGKYFPSHFNQV